VPFELAELKEVETERLDLGQDAVEGGPVQEPGEHGVRAVPLCCQRWEGRQDRRAEVAVYPDRIPGGCWVHEAMVGRWQVTPHHRDQVTAGLAPPVSGATPPSYGANERDTALRT
jgi:hypothetical protein